MPDNVPPQNLLVNLALVIHHLKAILIDLQVGRFRKSDGPYGIR